MYLNKYSNKTHRDSEEEVIKQQLHGWIYESHCWVVIKSYNHNSKVCKWCGCKSTIDMVMDDGKHDLCTRNPAIMLVLNMEAASQPILPREG